MDIKEYEGIIKNLTEIRTLMDENPAKAKQKLTNLINMYWNNLTSGIEDGVFNG